jgi:hypothetical protein
MLRRRPKSGPNESALIADPSFTSASASSSAPSRPAGTTCPAAISTRERSSASFYGDERPCYSARPRGAVAQFGRAPEWHSGGRRFDPVQLHQLVPTPPSLSSPSPPRLVLAAFAVSIVVSIAISAIAISVKQPLPCSPSGSTVESRGRPHQCAAVGEAPRRPSEDVGELAEGRSRPAGPFPSHANGSRLSGPRSRGVHRQQEVT